MISKNWHRNRPRGVEYDLYDIQLALVYSKQPDRKIYEHDVLVKWSKTSAYAYIVVYDEDIMAYIAYPLWGHSIPKTHIIDELELFENVFDFYIKYEKYREYLLPTNGPYKTFSKNLEFYLNNAGYSLYS